jgi:hypothetical protein
VDVEAVERQILHFLERVHKVLLGGVQTPQDGLHADHQQDEQHVHEREGRLEEVVVLLGDELADLVDESAEADAAEEGGEPDRIPVEVREEDEERDHHDQAAPEHVRDVQAAAAELRVAGHPQVETDDEDGADGRHQEQLDVHVGVGAADERAFAAHSVSRPDPKAPGYASPHDEPWARRRRRGRNSCALRLPALGSAGCRTLEEPHAAPQPHPRTARARARRAGAGRVRRHGRTAGLHP